MNEHKIQRNERQFRIAQDDGFFNGLLVTTGSSGSRIGGLIGLYDSSGRHIDNCYSTTAVSTGLSTHVGGLVGLHTKGLITNSFSAGAVSAGMAVGALVGRSSSNTAGDVVITNCYSTSPVHISTQHGGGLVGYAERVEITDCYSTGPVTAADYASHVGGLVGLMTSSAHVNRSYSTSSVNAGIQAVRIGGLVGSSGLSSITESYSTGPVTTAGGTGTWFIGGLVGSQSSGPISRSYSLSPVDSGLNSNYVGGLVGRTESVHVEHCFSAGAVQCDGANSGGMIGQAELTIVTTSFWDTEASGKTTSAGTEKGLGTAAMQTQNTFTSAGWDFIDTWKMYDYPGLAWQPEIGISGDFSVSISVGETAYLDFYVFALRNETVNWTLEGHESCPWITDATPISGDSTGPDDETMVRLTIDAAGLDTGRYVHELTVSDDNGGGTATILINLRVFQRVDFNTFALLASHWATDSCDFGQPCKEVDWYVDGAIDTRDLLQLTDGWLGEEVVKVRATVEEGFESGDFSMLDWQHGGDADWVISTTAYEGSYSARSGTIGDSQNSVLELTLDLTGWEIDRISFHYRVSSETSFDFLRFYIDDVEQSSWSGIMNHFNSATFSVTPGVRNFRWVYTKDASASAGEDCAWIDNVRIYAD